MAGEVQALQVYFGVGGGQVTWNVPSDVLLSGCAFDGTGADYLITTEPISLSPWPFSSNQILEPAVIAFSQSAGTSTREFSYQLSKGTMVYISADAAGSLALYYTALSN
jgi:hypothetical protein